MKIARTNSGHVGKVVTGATAVEEGKDRRRKGRQGAKILSTYTVECMMCRARLCLAFSNEYDLLERATMSLGAWGVRVNKTVMSKRKGASEAHQARRLRVTKGREIGLGGDDSDGVKVRG
jgi:hypothetical protein